MTCRRCRHERNSSRGRVRSWYRRDIRARVRDLNTPDVWVQSPAGDLPPMVDSESPPAPDLDLFHPTQSELVLYAPTMSSEAWLQSTVFVDLETVE